MFYRERFVPGEHNHISKYDIPWERANSYLYPIQSLVLITIIRMRTFFPVKYGVIVLFGCNILSIWIQILPIQNHVNIAKGDYIITCIRKSNDWLVNCREWILNQDVARIHKFGSHIHFVSDRWKNTPRPCLFHNLHLHNRINCNCTCCESYSVFVCVSYISLSKEQLISCPDSKVNVANVGPIWGRQDPGGFHVGPMNLAIWVLQIMEGLGLSTTDDNQILLQCIHLELK